MREKIEQLKKLLSEMVNPNHDEYRKITEIFNVYKDTYNPNIEPLKCTHEQLMFFLARKFISWDLLKLLRDKSSNKDVKSALFDSMFGLFYEMVSTIEKYDLEGWKVCRFDITAGEMHILKEHRNTKFHIPDDPLKFMERHQKFMSLALGERRFSEIFNKNGDALTNYMVIQCGKYSEIKEMVDETLLPSGEPKFLLDNFGWGSK